MNWGDDEADVAVLLFCLLIGMMLIAGLGVGGPS